MASPVPPIIALSQNSTIEAPAITTSVPDIDKQHAQEIDNYFASRHSPLAGYGTEFVAAANENNLDFRLLPALSIIESDGGLMRCKNVPNAIFGYGSCRMGFNSIDESIEFVAQSLGGNNPSTASYYQGKTTTQILHKYNSVIPGYANKVKMVMNMIDNTEPIS